MVKWDEHWADIKLGSHVCFTFEVFSPLILKCQQGDSMLHDSNFKAIINQLKWYFLEYMQFEVCKTTFDLAFIETIDQSIMRILALVYFYTTTQLFHSISTHSVAHYTEKILHACVIIQWRACCGSESAWACPSLLFIVEGVVHINERFLGTVCTKSQWTCQSFRAQLPIHPPLFLLFSLLWPSS